MPILDFLQINFPSWQLISKIPSQPTHRVFSCFFSKKFLNDGQLRQRGQHGGHRRPRGHGHRPNGVGQQRWCGGVSQLGLLGPFG